MSLFIIYIAALLLCWGSFLNFIAYRLVHDVSFRRLRSFCPNCNYQIAWFDLLPVLSWLKLRGRCRNCLLPVSILYPAIELTTVLIGFGLIYLTQVEHLLAYFIFVSALLITIRTDLETMLISRFTTLFLIPIAFIFSLTYFGHDPLLPINISDSIRGALFGFFILYLTNQIFLLLTKKDGMGQGDIDLLAMIGAFTGITGAWISLMIGSITGSFIGITMIYAGSYKLNTKVPFGPFLAFGAIVYTLFQNQLLRFIFY